MLHECGWLLHSATLCVSTQEDDRLADEWLPGWCYWNGQRTWLRVHRLGTVHEWLEHFVTIIGCTKEKPHILLLDGHVSHTTREAIEFARSHGLHIITFRPHSTHRRQPLDRTFFQVTKGGLQQSIRQLAVCA